MKPKLRIVITGFLISIYNLLQFPLEAKSILDSSLLHVKKPNSILVSFSPEYDYRWLYGKWKNSYYSEIGNTLNQFERPRFSYSINIELMSNIRNHKKFKIRYGLIYSSNNYFIKGIASINGAYPGYYTTLYNNPLIQKNKFLELPFLIEYSILNKNENDVVQSISECIKKHQWIDMYTLFGFSLSTNCDSLVYNSRKFSGYNESALIIQSEIMQYGTAFSLYKIGVISGLGLRLHMSNKISLFLEPRLRAYVYLNNMSWENNFFEINQLEYSIGANFGILKKF